MRSIGVSAGVEPVLRIIAGPTGAGKSALALRLAESSGATIISADSRQIYRGFDIGTAKPTAAERARVRHEGLDVAGPLERWSAARWADAAAQWIDEARDEGREAIVVGGTGFWLRALVHPLADEPPIEEGRRRALQAALGQLDLPTLRRWAQALDPARADLGRTQLLRAVEVALLSGTRLSDWHRAGESKPPREARWLVIDPGAAIATAIESRVDAMLDAGWEREVATLDAVVPADAPAWNACGYETIRELVAGTLERPVARERVIIATRQYAKRQRTWFRHQLQGERDVTRLDPRAVDSWERAQHWFERGASP